MHTEELQSLKHMPAARQTPVSSNLQICAADSFLLWRAAQLMKYCICRNDQQKIIAGDCQNCRGLTAGNLLLSPLPSKPTIFPQPKPKNLRTLKRPFRQGSKYKRQGLGIGVQSLRYQAFQSHPARCYIFGSHASQSGLRGF